MKKSDIAMIVLIGSVSICVAFFVANSLFGDINRTAKVQTIEQIDPSIVDPDSKVFNENAINPAVQVQINGTKQQEE